MKSRLLGIAGVASAAFLLLGTLTIVSQRPYMNFNTILEQRVYAQLDDQQFGFDSMQANTDQIIRTLTTPACQQAIDWIPRTLFPGGVAIPISKGAEDLTAPQFNNLITTLDRLHSAIDQQLSQIPRDCQDNAKRMSFQMAQWKDALLTVNEGFTTRFSAQDAAEGKLNVDLDVFGMAQRAMGKNPNTIQLVDPLNHKFIRVVWAGFWPPLGHLNPREDVITNDAIGKEECVTVLKEKKGVVPVLVPIKVPIWVEPWAARAQIIGFQIIWVWWWVPAEFIKEIDMCNPKGDEVVKTIRQYVILEWAQGHFWWYF